jgi:L,D-transpeptidase catalytic domain
MGVSMGTEAFAPQKGTESAGAGAPATTPAMRLNTKERDPIARLMADMRTSPDKSCQNISLRVLEFYVLVYSRRFFINLALAGLACGPAAPRLALGQTQPVDGQIDPRLLRRALDALEQHYESISYRDFIGVVDFSLPSRAPRFHLVNLADSSVRSHLVAHGRGSDPAHTGWLERFSNEPRSHATSAGAYRTDSLYVGAHGRSMRLEGLDLTNSNALARAIVVHGAWYVNEELIGHTGVLGRSEGCFAVADSSLPEIITRLGPGRLIYAGSDQVPA